MSGLSVRNPVASSSASSQQHPPQSIGYAANDLQMLLEVCQDRTLTEDARCRKFIDLLSLYGITQFGRRSHMEMQTTPQQNVRLTLVPERNAAQNELAQDATPFFCANGVRFVVPVPAKRSAGVRLEVIGRGDAPDAEIAAIFFKIDPNTIRTQADVAALLDTFENRIQSASRLTCEQYVQRKPRHVGSVIELAKRQILKGDHQTNFMHIRRTLIQLQDAGQITQVLDASIQELRLSQDDAKILVQRLAHACDDHKEMQASMSYHLFYGKWGFEHDVSACLHHAMSAHELYSFRGGAKAWIAKNPLKMRHLFYLGEIGRLVESLYGDRTSFDKAKQIAEGDPYKRLKTLLTLIITQLSQKQIVQMITALICLAELDSGVRNKLLMLIAETGEENATTQLAVANTYLAGTWGKEYYRKALDCAQKALNLMSDNATAEFRFDVHSTLGKALLLNEREGAKESFEKALQIFPDDVSAKQGLADALRRSGKLDEAKAALEGVKRDENSLFLLADIERRKGNLRDAERLVQEGIDLNPESARACARLHLLKAAILKADKKDDVAQKAFVEVCRLHPDLAKPSEQALIGFEVPVTV